MWQEQYLRNKQEKELIRKTFKMKNCHMNYWQQEKQLK